MEEKSHRFSSKKPIVKAKMIFDTCIPRSTPYHITRHIRAKKKSNIMNPIKALFEKGEPPVIVHCVIPVQPGMKLWQLPWHRIPPTWRNFLKNKYRLLFHTDISSKETPRTNVHDATAAAEVNSEKMSKENRRPDKEALLNIKNITSSILSHSPTKRKVNNSNTADNKQTVKEVTVEVSTSCDEPKKLTNISKKLTWDQKQPADLRINDRLEAFSPFPEKDKGNKNVNIQNSLKPTMENITKFENKFYLLKMTGHSESLVGTETRVDKLKECDIKRSLKKKVTFCHDVDSNYHKLQEINNSLDGEQIVSKSDLGVKSMTKSVNLSLEKRCKEKKKLSSSHYQFFTQCSPSKVKFKLKFANSNKYNSINRLHTKNSKSIKNCELVSLSDSFCGSDSFTNDSTEQGNVEVELNEQSKSKYLDSETVANRNNLKHSRSTDPSRTFSHSPKPPSKVKLKTNLLNN